ncbi:hypothetical protein EXW50_16300 [Bacillus mycoides]|uniref:DEAD/DEAH box helicase family protein n=1 Tax=Bacillus mycoides TaxID=1405 RepID=UPI001C01A856|nr:DEAD/DEAH box helicase family protein [Bacillus mycoides]QWG56870.1 hypothetical protein EXW26_16295 [Bacillus mycoides]QWG75352.1 hypothetical protein EXW63_25740 [Bacillus mycoides]QWH23878.1 hypothetical protein EXW50_16300 [Bacillus mycoides]
MSNQVKIIDSMMGTGKTSYAIQLMREADISQKFIYVTPFLEEVQRIKTEVSNRDFKEPENRHGSGTKLESLKRLIANGHDITTTHALFAMADEELVDLLQWENYMLIIDEVMEVVLQLQGLRRDDIPVLVSSDLIKIDADTSQVIWISDPKLDTKYNTVRDYALAGNLYAVNNAAFVWNFPAKIFNLFEQVYIMTYLFDGQLQRYYYDLHGVQYDYYAVVKESDRYELVPRSTILEDRSKLKELIQIYDGRLNEIGDKDTALSKSWFGSKHNGTKVKQLKDNLYNYFRNVQKAKADSILWTTFKDVMHKLKGKGFSKEEQKDSPDAVGKACFTAFNLRATNKYKHKTVLAFCLNRYMNPIEKQFFHRHDVLIDEDLLALSDLLQWIFRSAVREGNPVWIYVPSRRMRTLLMKWLNNEL